MKSVLFIACFATASSLFLRSYCKRVVNVYLDWGVESITVSKFMDAIKNRSIRYIKDSNETNSMRSVTFTLTKEESILVERFVTRLESN